MDTLFSVVASDIISHLISSLITKYRNMNTADKLERLQWLLLRARTIVEEANGRQISNQGMLLQLRQLMQSMYQGYYILNTFQEQHIAGRRRQSLKLKKLQAAMEGLEATVDDMKEFIVFLLGCPCLPQRPYDTHLFMEKCMFGRHEEKELIRDFLLQPCDSLSVLPIIGPREVGKNTLIEHVCSEESVREHFSRIVRFKSDDLNNQGNESFIKGRELVASSIMSLVVVELVNDDISDETWRRFCSSIDSGCSKMVVISRSDTISVLGTTQALKLKRLNRHEFWYFFRTLAFGSANPEDHPELLRIARRIATQIKVLALHMGVHQEKAVKLQLLACGEHSWDIVSNSRHYYLSGHSDGPLHLCNDGYKTVNGCLVKDELPKIIADDMLIRTSAFYEGSFDILRWKSPIPPIIVT
uniref:Rx N-terminal domain-containing protein n=1 Tax=Oryza punctata TaxID=4537 RepID=A0A0E0JKF8_ORYPU